MKGPPPGGGRALRGLIEQMYLKTQRVGEYDLSEVTVRKFQTFAKVRVHPGNRGVEEPMKASGV